MAKVRDLKKVLLTAVCAAVMLFGSVSMCFADTADTKVYVNVAATGIDFTVTESVTLTGTADSTDLSASNIVVTNNSTVGVLNISSIAATAEDGWTLANQSTDWSTLPANDSKIGLVADGTCDLAAGAYTGAGSVNPGSSDTTTLSGNTGMVTTALSNEQVAKVTVTVALK